MADFEGDMEDIVVVCHYMVFVYGSLRKHRGVCEVRKHRGVCMVMMKARNLRYIIGVQINEREISSLTFIKATSK